MTPEDIVSRFGGASPTLNLYPIENRMSDGARSLLASDLVSRYPGMSGPGYLYGDPSGVGELYEECARVAREYFQVDHALVHFLSGLHAMQSMISTLSLPGERIVSLGPDAGGHYATEQICRDFGHDVGTLPFDTVDLRLDMDRLAEQHRTSPSRFYYLDLSTALRVPDMARMREAVGDDALICFDASHVLGLLPVIYDLPDFWRHISLCTASTHKTLPGPQKAVMLTSDDRVAGRMAEHLKFRVSSAHSNSVGALAVTLGELMDSRKAYARSVIANARKLAELLSERGQRVLGEHFGFTETHQVWVLPPRNTSDAVAWGARLQQCGIRAAVVHLPGQGTSGLRLGTQELTRMGMDLDAMGEVVDLICRALEGGHPETLAKEVAELTARYPTVRTTFA
ncbi:serine hydroxymethyltransferase [Streptomyces sp. NPDC048290]|uniref:serine hydroxymethyltransferase n=1 Tax=Streptomyces sp. NPDC048290 TaxID=3155811 RepID=UPI003433B3ED